MTVAGILSMNSPQAKVPLLVSKIACDHVLFGVLVNTYIVSVSIMALKAELGNAMGTMEKAQDTSANKDETDSAEDDKDESTAATKKASDTEDGKKGEDSSSVSSDDASAVTDASAASDDSSAEKQDDAKPEEKKSENKSV